MINHITVITLIIEFIFQVMREYFRSPDEYQAQAHTKFLLQTMDNQTGSILISALQ